MGGSQLRDFEEVRDPNGFYCIRTTGANLTMVKIFVLIGQELSQLFVQIKKINLEMLANGWVEQFKKIAYCNGRETTGSAWTFTDFQVIV